MADINDVKSKLIKMLASSEQKEKKISDSTSIVCVFRLDSFQEVEVIGEALKKNYVVLLDLSACDDENKQRIKDFMKGVAYPMQIWIQEMSEAIYAYFPDSYQIQEFQN